MQRKLATLCATVAILLAGMLTLSAAPANAAPYSNQVTCSVSTSTPAEGATITVSCSGFGASLTVIIELHSATYQLAVIKSNGSGNVSTSVRLPAGVTGNHTLVARSPSSGQLASVPLDIGGTAAGGGGGSSGGGGLSSTGVAVIGLGALGLTLLVGGGLMLLAGRRRKAAV